MMVVERIRMANMPFDKFVDGRFIHATGDLVTLEDGTTEIEYEDLEYEDAPDCKYSEEDDEEELEEYHCIYEYGNVTVEAQKD